MSFIPKYPIAPRSDTINVYQSEKRGEVKVPDPYDKLQETNDETTTWIDENNKITHNFLNSNPDRQPLEEAIRKNWNYSKFSSPDLKGDNRWYWYYNSGLQAQSVIYRTMDEKLPVPQGDDAPGEIFFDPNLLSADGTAALSVTRVSKDGNFFAYGISRSGSDFYTIYIRPTSAPFAPKDGEEVSHDHGRLSDEIRFVKFSGISWTSDSKGFFYQRYPERESHGDAESDAAGTELVSDQNARLCYHRVGTPQSEDVLVYTDESYPERTYHIDVTEEDGRYAVMSVSKDTARKNLLWIADLEQNPIGQNMEWDKLIDEFDAAYDLIGNDGPIFYFHTTKNAPQWKVVSVDISKPPQDRVWKDVIPEDKGATLEEVHLFNNDQFAVKFKRNVIDEVHIYAKDGTRLTRIGEEFVGTADLNSHRSQSWFWATFADFTSPGVIVQYDAGKEESKRWFQWLKIKVKGLNGDDFMAEQVWYSSKDGTKVPMFIVRHKSTKYDGTAPAIQYGYGGFNISVDPFFSASVLTVLERYGAVLAVPNIRGGGEFGEEWHEAGIRERKVNSYDDFIAATQFLVDNKYVAPGKVCINGGSNGGLLVAACMQRAPEGLIGAVISDVGVHDLLKYTDYTIGRAWVADYGDPYVPHDFDFIYPISPVHNVREGTVMPPTLLLTADHDDRVVPLHSYKLAATLHHTLPNNPNPILLRVDTKSGHGAGKSTEKRIVEAADKWGFAAQTLGWKPRTSRL